MWSFVGKTHTAPYNGIDVFCVADCIVYVPYTIWLFFITTKACNSRFHYMFKWHAKLQGVLSKAPASLILQLNYMKRELLRYM